MHNPANIKFEEWFSRELPVHNRDAESGEWHAGVLKAACELAWRSSRLAVVVELPPPLNITYKPDAGGQHDMGNFYSEKQFIEALADAGVTVK